ncbi:BTAD domain-containing putative transcriptional regulator [Pelagibius sp.]|uniref:BTAD domain-containing putative transcriptional regulator n=1 Tax=Pelagibius sp. TaxID=1931238 RepID=UPI0026214904|nr:BTAD domain-containing putative transcriptional regulator [Pelagibius sp.]
MAALDLRLLGKFEGRLNSGPAIEFPTTKTRLLLSFLALSPGTAQPRRKLASLLWGDRGDEQALHSLRNSLSALRKVFAELDPSPLVADRRQVDLDPASVSVDAVRFQSLVAAGSPEALKQACALYRGDLLEEVESGEQSFEDWLFYERQRLRRLALQAFERLLAHQREDGSAAQAAETAQRLLQLDPTHEATHRVLMALHAAQGQRAAALEQYRHCRSALQRDLDIGPAPETEALYREILHRHGETAVSGAAPASNEPAALPLPEKPSIAVLPFKNLAPDDRSDHFVDGLTESIISELSRHPDLFVIASTSVFTYKGQPVKVQRVAQDLGVRHVLEGSVQMSESRVRVTAQLIDALNGHHLWAERYEGELTDIFALQDEVTRKIVGSLATSYGGRLTKAWRTLSLRKTETKLSAYDCLLRGEMQIEEMTRSAVLAARRLFERAIEIDPRYARAHAKLAFTYILALSDGWAGDSDLAADRARALARKAIDLDDADPWGHWALGTISFCGFADYDRGLECYETALALCPNDADVLADHGWVLSLAGRPRQGIERIQQAMRLNPRCPRWYMTGLGLAYHDAGLYEQAVTVLEKGPLDNPTLRLYLAASYSRLGRDEQAYRQVETIRKAEPGLSVEGLRTRAAYRHAKDFEHLLEGLMQAGLELPS